MCSDGGSCRHLVRQQVHLSVWFGRLGGQPGQQQIVRNAGRGGASCLLNAIAMLRILVQFPEWPR